MPSRIPETDSDSWTIEETSASETWRSAVTFLRCSPTRFVSQTNSGSRMSANSREPPVEQEHRDDRRDHRGHVREHRGRRRSDDRVDAADVVRDAALHVARARAREEGEREPLQVPVDGGAQVVHDRLADLVREQRLETPMAPVTTEIATIRATSAVSSPVRWSGMAVSRMCLSRNGGITPSAAEKRISLQTTASAAGTAEEREDPAQVGLRTAGSAGRSTGSPPAKP